MTDQATPQAEEAPKSERKKPPTAPKPPRDVTLEEVRQSLLNKAAQLVDRVSSPQSEEKTAKAEVTTRIVTSLVAQAAEISAEAIQLDRTLAKARAEAKPAKEKKAKKDKATK